MDAPVTGGSMGAKAGTLTIFCGGTADVFEKCLPFLEVYGKKVAHVGPTGAGQWMKLANQIAVGGALLSLCESLSFAQKARLNIEQARELLGSGAGGSWAMEHYGKMILAEDWTPGFSVQNQRKDFGYCFDAASEIGANIPTTRIADDLLARLEAAGRGADTTAALFDVYQGKVDKA
jgi:3-hydroxyisobutyrate dehydrogenase-like beta-hydroxyacid dehydrogenase